MYPWKFAARTLALALAWAGTLSAHPTDQGRLDLRRDGNTLLMEVSLPTDEPVYLPGENSPPPRPDSETLSQFGPRFPHIELKINGVKVAGKETGTPQEKSEPWGNWLCYELAFPLDGEPKRLELILTQTQSSSFVVAYQHPDRRIDQRLLVPNEPLRIPLVAGPDGTTTTGSADGKWALFADYLKHGIWHILTGYDHLLFVAALLLATVSFWDLVKVVTAFTLAHTVTLALSVLNVVRLSEQVVEPMIAASIVFVAVQNIVAPTQSRGWTRYALAFGFGLFHGLGFAGGLLEAMEGLGSLSIWTALLAFSLGVEIGHQCVVMPLFVGRKLALRESHGPLLFSQRHRRVALTGSALIALAGVYYFAMAIAPLMPF